MTVSSILSNPLFTALLGAGFGSLGTFTIRKYFDVRQMKRRRTNLRRAFAAEILDMVDQIESLGKFVVSDNFEQSRTIFPHSSPITTTVYEGSVADVGILTEDEVQAIVNFYSNSQRINSIINSYSGPDEVPATQAIILNRQLALLNNQKNSVLDELSNHINIPDSKSQTEFEIPQEKIEEIGIPNS